jgi:hypothetical protein
MHTKTSLGKASGVAQTSTKKTCERPKPICFRPHERGQKENLEMERISWTKSDKRSNIGWGIIENRQRYGTKMNPSFKGQQQVRGERDGLDLVT